MSEDFKAGALILSQFKMFNEAMILHSNVIEPSFFEGLGQCIESFCDKQSWSGNFDRNEANIWLAPEGFDSEKSWFELDSTGGENDYWLALFFGVPTQPGEAGFSFTVDPKSFGGKNAWNAHCKTISQDKINQLNELGFQNRGKGSFFLPVRLDCTALAETYGEYGEFTKDDECFAPLYAALEKLKASVPIFDEIMRDCLQLSVSDSA